MHDVENVLMQFLSLLSQNLAPLVTYPVNKKDVCDRLSWTLSVVYSESGIILWHAAFTLEMEAPF